MKLFTFVGGELVDPMVAESVVNFNYSLFAEDTAEAEDAFYTIFPGCFIVSISSNKI